MKQDCCADKHVSEYLSFQRWIAPRVFRCLFWLAVVLVICGGIAKLHKDFPAGVILILLGPVAVRVAAELLLLPFKALEYIEGVRNELVQLNAGISVLTERLEASEARPAGRVRR